MADNFHTGNMLAEYSLNLLRGQMIAQLMTGRSLVGSGGVSLTEFILGKQRQPARRSGTDMMNDALTGLMRSDAAMLRQASKNMLQGKALLQTGGEAIGLIREKIKRMSEIVTDLQNGGANTSALEAEYDALAAQIKSIIKDTQFNGIKLLDGENWAADESVSINGETGKISLQAGKASSELTLYDLQNYKNAFTAASDLNPAVWADTAARLEAFAASLEGMASGYNARSGLLDSEAASFERQADILGEAAGKAKEGDEESFRQTLIDILMRDGGYILSGVS